jgi:Subtilase family
MRYIERVWAEAYCLRECGYSGRGVGVGHLDTGLDPDHPALRHQPRSFCYFDSKGFPRLNCDPFDARGHGTGVASIVCGRGRNGECVGIAPDCDLHAAAVLEGGDVVSRIVFGLEWMLRRPVRVLCAPLGIPGYTPIFHGIVTALARNDILVVAPIGNLGAGRSLSPGDYEDVLSVGALDADGDVAAFSGSYHRGADIECEKPDVLAPGRDVRVAAPGGDYRFANGTSIACGLVAGVAAALRQAAPWADAASIKAALVETCFPLPEEKRHRCNGGIIQPKAALHRVLRCRETVNALSSSVRELKVERHHPEIHSKYVDRRLAQALRYATHDTLLEAIFIADSSGNVDCERDPCGAAERPVEAVGRLLGERPKRLRYVPVADLAVVLASAPYLRRLIDRPDVLVASAVDTDRAQSRNGT